MEDLLNINKTFEKVIVIGGSIRFKEFEGCIFRQCDFSNADLSNNTFLDCEFIDCNLSMLQITQTSLQSVFFKKCKVLGIQFQSCTDFLFQVNFEDCILDFASFANKKMPKTKFVSCSMKDVNFIGSQLTSAVFDQCNLENAIFNETILIGADFTTAVNYKINPEFNPMKKAQFSASGIIGLLEQYDIIIE